MDELVGIFGVIGVFGTTAYVAYVILEGIRSRYQSRIAAEFNSKLFDRVASAQELGNLLKSEGGERLLTTITGKMPGAAQTRIVRALQTGIVLVTFGCGLFLYQWFSPGLDVDVADGVTLVSVIALSIGVGLLLAAGASYLMSKKLGLLDDSQRNDRHPVPSA
jgi:hypothetical protein